MKTIWVIASPLSHPSVFIFPPQQCVPALREGLHAWLRLHPTASAGTAAATHHRSSAAPGGYQHGSGVGL